MFTVESACFQLTASRVAAARRNVNRILFVSKERRRRASAEVHHLTVKTFQFLGQTACVPG